MLFGNRDSVNLPIQIGKVPNKNEMYNITFLKNSKYEEKKEVLHYKGGFEILQKLQIH